MVKIEKNYVFDGLNGKQSLESVFDGRGNSSSITSCSIQRGASSFASTKMFFTPIRLTPAVPNHRRALTASSIPRPMGGNRSLSTRQPAAAEADVRVSRNKSRVCCVR
jgi:hypothetical protein